MDYITARDLIRSGASISPDDLPKIAGAEGIYNIPLPSTHIYEQKLELAGEQFTQKITNILSLSQPPLLMERWKLLKISYPVAVQIQKAALGAAKPIFEGTLKLVSSNEVVWSQTQAATCIMGAGKKLAVAQLSFTDQFIVPIFFPHGRTLSLELEYTAEVETLPALLYVGMGGNVRVEAEEKAKEGLAQGFLEYESESLSGHRRL